MPDPITTLGLGKTTSDIIKEALDFARKAKNSELAEKLIDLYQNFVQMSESNQELKNEIQRLQGQIARERSVLYGLLGCGWQVGSSVQICVVRKNSIWARKTMEMLSLSSLVSSPVGCRNPGAKRPDHTVLAKTNRFSTDLGCAILNHVSSGPLSFALARLLRPSRW